MKRAQLMAWAQDVIALRDYAVEPMDAIDLDAAHAVLKILEAPHPCGFQDFTLIEGQVWTSDGCITFGTADDARGVAASLIRAADALEAQAKTAELVQKLRGLGMRKAGE